mgnify:CR=1 FL=1
MAGTEEADEDEKDPRSLPRERRDECEQGASDREAMEGEGG